MSVTDRWHKSRPRPGEPVCAEHGKVPTGDHGQGDRWQARWRDETARQRKQNFARKLDADTHDAATRAALSAGTWIDPQAGRVKLADYWRDRFLPAQLHLRPNSRDLYVQHFRAHIEPALGGRPLRSIGKPDVRSFVSVISATLAPSTVHTVFAVMRAVMAAAADDRLIASNPCSHVALPEIDPRVVEPLPAVAVHALADAITARYRLFVTLGAGAGLRFAEAAGLTVNRVEFLHRQIHVREQLQRRSLAPLKTRASQRTVPADDFVLQAITAHMQQWRPGANQIIITNRLGAPVQRNSFGDRWRQAVADAGLPAGTRFHDLRHFYASALISGGLNPKVIQARLGHATISETMDTYGHLFPDSDDLGRGAVATLLASADVPSQCPEVGDLR